MHPFGWNFVHKHSHIHTHTQTDRHTDKLQWKYIPFTISWRCNKTQLALGLNRTPGVRIEPLPQYKHRITSPTHYTSSTAPDIHTFTKTNCDANVSLRQYFVEVLQGVITFEVCGNENKHTHPPLSIDPISYMGRVSDSICVPVYVCVCLCVCPSISVLVRFYHKAIKSNLKLSDYRSPSVADQSSSNLVEK